MSPHRYTFGFAYDFPFALIVAVVTVAAVVFGRQKVGFRATRRLHDARAHGLVHRDHAVRARARGRHGPVGEGDEGVPAHLLAAFLIRTREQINALSGCS